MPGAPDTTRIEGTISRVLDEGGRGRMWKAVALIPSKDGQSVERLVLTSPTPLDVLPGDDFSALGQLASATPWSDGYIHDSFSIQPLAKHEAGRLKLERGNKNGKILEHLQDAQTTGLSISRSRSGRVSDPDLQWVSDVINDPSVSRYRAGFTMAVDPSAAWAAAISDARQGTATGDLKKSVQKRFEEELSGALTPRHKTLAAQDFSMGSAQVRTFEFGAGEYGQMVTPAEMNPGTMEGLKGISGPLDMIVPKDVVSPETYRRYVAMHEFAHAHQSGFGFKRGSTTNAMARREESFADSVAIASLILRGQDPREVNRIVMAREASAIWGGGTHVSGLAARRAFEWACEARKKAEAEKPARTVPLLAIMRAAASIAESSYVKDDKDLERVRRFLGAVPGGVTGMSAREISKRIKEFNASASKSDFTDLPLLKRTMAGAAKAIETGAWTLKDLSDPKVAMQHMAVVRKDVIATIRHSSKGIMHREQMMAMMEDEPAAAKRMRNDAIWVQIANSSRGIGLTPLLNKGLARYLSDDKRLDRFATENGLPGLLRKVTRGLGKIGLVDDTSERIVAGAVSAASARIGMATLVLADLPRHRVIEPSSTKALLAIDRKTPSPANGIDPWSLPLAKRVDLLGSLSKRAALLSREADRNDEPKRLALLQDAFDDVMTQRADVLRSLTSMRATCSSLSKYLDSKSATPGKGRDLTIQFARQSLWEVPSELTRLPLAVHQTDNVRRQLTETAAACGNPVRAISASKAPDPVPPQPVQRPQAATVRQPPGGQIRRDEFGKVHCETDFAVRLEDGTKRAFINGKKGFVVRLDSTDGSEMTTRILDEFEAMKLALLFGGRAVIPTDADFLAINRDVEVSRTADFIPLGDGYVMERALSS